MKKILTLVTFSALSLLISCGTSRNFETNPEDRDISKIIKKLNKKSTDTNLQNELKTLYAQSVKKHEDNISVYESLSGMDKWDKALGEYNALQELYNDISASTVAYKIIAPRNYYAEIENVKSAAAEDFYREGLENLNGDSRDALKSAYYAFKKSTQYIANYKDALQQMQNAFDKSTINVIVNPVRDNNMTLYSAWDFGFERNYLQESLVRDLGGKYANTLPAKFFTESDARAYNIQPDWIIDLNWDNLLVPPIQTEQYSSSESKNIQVGTDTAGHAVVQTVYANLTATRRFITLNGSLEYRIWNANNKETIEWNRVNTDYSWTDESASYTGDSRALSVSDWAMINNTRMRIPTNDEVMNEMVRRVYPDLKSRIRNAVDW